MDRKINLMLKKGILATDERPESMGKKFSKHGISNTLENRIDFRRILYSTENLEEYIGGVIMHKEAYENKDLVGILQSKGILIGVKLDEGLIEKDNQYLCKENKNLREEIKKIENFDFAKWRALFRVNFSTMENIHANCKILIDYANLCIEHNIIPIVEPEILWEDNPLEEMAKFAKILYGHLLPQLTEKMILKCSFITGSKTLPVSIEKSAQQTVDIFMQFSPLKIPGCVFLSGGHDSAESVEILKTVKKLNPSKDFLCSFSFGRALTDKAMEAYGKQEDAQSDFLKILKLLRN